MTDFSTETGTFINRYQYDGLHRRIARTDDDGTTTHYYYNENWQVLTETDGDGNATAIYSPFFLPNRLQARRDPVNRLQNRFGQRLGLRVISRVAKMLQ